MIHLGIQYKGPSSDRIQPHSDGSGRVCHATNHCPHTCPAWNDARRQCCRKASCEGGMVSGARAFFVNSSRLQSFTVIFLLLLSYKVTTNSSRCVGAVHGRHGRPSFMVAVGTAMVRWLYPVCMARVAVGTAMARWSYPGVAYYLQDGIVCNSYSQALRQLLAGVF